MKAHGTAATPAGLGAEIAAALVGGLDLRALAEADAGTARLELNDAIGDVLAAWRIDLPGTARAAIEQEIADELFGLGPLDALLARPDITDIVVNGAAHAFIECGDRLTPLAPLFRDAAHLTAICQRIAARGGARLDAEQPICDTRLACGARVSMVLPPVAVGGPHLAIRKFGGGAATLDTLRGLAPDLVALLRQVVAERGNVLIVGGAGTGKTTLLDALLGAVPASQRIVVCEDVGELRCGGNVARLQTRAANLDGAGRLTLHDLVRCALRLRPDRIVVGEVRGAEAFDLVQAMTTGHAGSMGTLHANSAEDALIRLESLLLVAGLGLDARAAQRLVAGAVTHVLQLTRSACGARRVVRLAQLGPARGGGLHDLWRAA